MQGCSSVGNGVLQSEGRATGQGRVLSSDISCHIWISVQDFCLNATHRNNWEQNSVSVIKDAAGGAGWFGEGFHACGMIAVVWQEISCSRSVSQFSPIYFYQPLGPCACSF